MKLLNSILFASLALGATLVHADPACNTMPNGGREANAHLSMYDRGVAKQIAPTTSSSSTVSR